MWNGDHFEIWWAGCHGGLRADTPKRYTRKSSQDGVGFDWSFFKFKDNELICIIGIIWDLFLGLCPKSTKLPRAKPLKSLGRRNLR
jgi:hypothetical protein